MTALHEVAAIFTIVGGSLALIQLTAILVRLNRRPRLLVQTGAIRTVLENGQRRVVVQVITTNSGSLSARTILWNYDLPAEFRVLGSEVEHHERNNRVTLVRALEHLHPNVETHHDLSLELPGEMADFELRYRIHLEDARPQSGVLMVSVGKAAAAPRGAS